MSLVAQRPRPWNSGTSRGIWWLQTSNGDRPLRIFISHAHADAALLSAFKELIERIFGRTTVAVDYSSDESPGGIQAGMPWREWILDKAAASSATPRGLARTRNHRSCGPSTQGPDRTTDILVRRFRRGGHMVQRAEDRRSPRIARIGSEEELPTTLDRLGLRLGRPVLVLVGGAGGMDEDEVRALDVVLRQAVLPAVVERDAAVVDGGTDSGVMRAMGRARSDAHADFALVGVAAEGTVRVPGDHTPKLEDAADPEGNHSHLILVPGRAWGAESAWIAQVADVIAAESPSVTMLVNGGEIAFTDISSSLERRRPVVVLAGTGRSADAIAATRETSGADSRADWIADSQLTTILPVQDVGSIRATLAAALTERREP